METFIYQADVHCPTCAQKIKDALDAAGKRPADPSDESSFDSDDYPKGPHDGEESDTPQHCGTCHVYLGQPLTKDGVTYVEEKLKEFTETGRGNFEVLDQWAQTFAVYHLHPEKKRRLTREQNAVLVAYRKRRGL